MEYHVLEKSLESQDDLDLPGKQKKPNHALLPSKNGSHDSGKESFSFSHAR